MTGDTNAAPISDPDLDVGGTDEVDVSTIWTDDMIYSCQNIGGIYELADMFLMHACSRTRASLTNGKRRWMELSTSGGRSQ